MFNSGIFKTVDDVIGKTGVKILVYGKAGIGKSTFVGTFPKILLIDSEDGQKFFLKNNPNFVGVAKTQSHNEVKEALRKLDDEEAMKQFTTIAIDSYSKLYDNMQDTAYQIAYRREKDKLSKGKEANPEDTNISMRDWGHIGRWNRELNNVISHLSSLGKIVVVTAREKEITEKRRQGNEYVNVVVGYEPDLKKHETYDWDIIIRIVEETDQVTGDKKRVMQVVKDRMLGEEKGSPRVEQNVSFDVWEESFKEYVNLEDKGGTDYSKDVEKSIENQEDEDLRVIKMIEDNVEKIKVFSKEASAEQKNKLLEIMRKHKITKIDVNAGELAIQEIVDYIDGTKAKER